MIAEALGARHGDLRLTAFCVESDWLSQQIGQAKGSGLTWLPCGYLSFASTLPRMATGGTAYGFWSCQGRLNATIAQAMESDTGDMNLSNLLNLLANRSILGLCHLVHVEWKTSGRRDHSVWMIWPNQDSLSASTFNRPGMCLALRVS